MPTLLVVDSEESTRGDLAKTLEVSGYAVVSVRDADGAVGFCLTVRPSAVLVGDSLSLEGVESLAERLVACCWDMPPIVLVTTAVQERAPRGVDHVFARDPRQHGALLRLLEAVAAPPSRRFRKHGSGVVPRAPSTRSSAPPRAEEPRGSEPAMRDTGVRSRSSEPLKAEVARVPLKKKRS